MTGRNTIRLAQMPLASQGLSKAGDNINKNIYRDNYGHHANPGLISYPALCQLLR
jgi:hypothetical protein